MARRRQSPGELVERDSIERRHPQSEADAVLIVVDLVLPWVWNGGPDEHHITRTG